MKKVIGRPEYIVTFKDLKAGRKELKDLGLKKIRHEFKHVFKNAVQINLTDEQVTLLEGLDNVESVQKIVGGPMRKFGNPASAPSYNIWPQAMGVYDIFPTNSYQLDTTYTSVGVNGLNKNITGKGVKIAVLDEGADITHPALQGKIVETATFAANYWEEVEQFAPMLRPAIMFSNTGTNGTWAITASNNKLAMKFGPQTLKTITLTQGTRTTAQIVAEINSLYGMTCAYVYEEDAQYFYLKGLVSNDPYYTEIYIDGTVANSAHNTLGLQAADPLLGGPLANFEEHGTHVSGIIAATYTPSIQGDWKSDKAITGVAPDVQIYHGKVLSGYGLGDFAWMIPAIDWAISKGVHIINMSLGGHVPNDPLIDAALKRAYDAGILLLGATGNESFTLNVTGTPYVSYPANSPYVMAVSNTGVDQDTDTRTYNYIDSDSNIGPEVDISQYGEVDSCVPLVYYPGNNYPIVRFGGTSMSTPIIAGMAALYKERYGSHVDGIGLRNLLTSFTKRAEVSPDVVAEDVNFNNAGIYHNFHGAGIAVLPNFDTFLPVTSIKTIGETILDQTKLG